MGPVLHHEQLNYRDGREGDVDPVRIQREPGGAVRVVVRFSPRARDAARTRALILAAIVGMVVALAALAAWLFGVRLGGTWYLVPMVLGQFGLTFVVVMAIIWWRAGWVTVFEAGADQLVVETRGRLMPARRVSKREHVKDVRVFRDRRGRVRAMEIKAAGGSAGGIWLIGLDARDIGETVSAIREGLGMEAAS